jgi:hypothetical protein
MPKDDGFFVVRSIPPVTMRDKLIGALHWTIVLIGLCV